MTEDASALYRDFLRLMAKTLEGAEIAHADAEFIACGKNILSFLRSQRGADIESIVVTGKAPGGWLPEGTAEDVAAMSLDAVERLIDNPKTPRHVLERLARHRFSVTRGELSALSGRGRLLDRLQSLIENERTHTSIGRAASDPKDRLETTERRVHEKLPDPR